MKASKLFGIVAQAWLWLNLI